MNHKLRARRLVQVASVAAEVLECRALLSSAGSAVQSAAHHATAQTHAIAPHGFHVSQNAEIQLGTTPFVLLPVKFSLSSLKPVVGSKVTAHASAVINSPGQKETFKATWIGTVKTVTQNGPDTDFAITPTGGSIVVKITGGGQKFTATAFPNGTPSGATLVGRKFISFQATDLFTADSVTPFTSQTIFFDVDTE